MNIHTPGYSHLVTLDDLSIPASYGRALEALEDIGFGGSIVYGGALRDAFFGIKPRDVDVRADDTRLGLEAENSFTGHTHFKQMRQPEIRLMGGVCVHMHMYMRFEDVPLHIVSAAYRSTASELCLKADAPLNGLAMGRDGVVHAHPRFKEHAQARLYAPMERGYDYDVRFQKLSAKITGLRFRPGA